MGKREKLLQHMNKSPKGIRFEELDNLLLSIGFTRRQPKSGSSHYIYKLGKYKLVIPRKNPVKQYYIKEALKILELLNIE